jgi:NTP pyrophosphatase (non-canonical NTP hydrolase)
MNLQQAIEAIWDNRKYEPSSDVEAISHLNEEVAESLKALLRGDRDTAQAELEDALSCMFIAFKMMDVSLDEVIERQVNQMKNAPKKTMHIFSDRVEIRMGDEIKGGWAIWTSEDIKDAQKMAKEFKCKIIWEGANQLSLSDMLKDGKTP